MADSDETVKVTGDSVIWALQPIINIAFDSRAVVDTGDREKPKVEPDSEDDRPIPKKELKAGSKNPTLKPLGTGTTSSGEPRIYPKKVTISIEIE